MAHPDIGDLLVLVNSMDRPWMRIISDVTCSRPRWRLRSSKSEQNCETRCKTRQPFALRITRSAFENDLILLVLVVVVGDVGLEPTTR